MVHYAPARFATPFDEVAFIDAGLQRVDTLLHRLHPGIAVFSIERRRHGLVQMREALEGLRGLAAIHVIAHGEPGALLLGRTRITRASMLARAKDLAAIGDALEPDGELIVYGCNLAKGAVGRLWLRALAQATHSHVTAANAPVGSAALGGTPFPQVHVGPPARRPLDLGGYVGLLRARDRAPPRSAPAARA